LTKGNGRKPAWKTELPALELAIGFQHTWSKLRALIRHVRLQRCDESLNGAGQWCAAKIYIHWPDPTRTPYTLLVLDEKFHTHWSKPRLIGGLAESSKRTSVKSFYA
jgi:hypothetical protein